MDLPDLLTELLDRVDGHVQTITEGLEPEQLTWAPAEEANSIGWLVWHLTRVQDHHISELLETEQIWVAGDWGPRFGLESFPGNTGYGHSPEEARRVQPESAQALVDHHAAVSLRTRQLLSTVTQPGLDRVVDASWDPPVTLGARLVSILDDDVQHAGQAAYVRGLLP